jgi:hypothetical protein
MKKDFGSITLDFQHIPLVDLTEYFSLFQSFKAKALKGLDYDKLVSISKMKDIPEGTKVEDIDVDIDTLMELTLRSFGIIQEPFYKPLKALFFKHIMVVGYGYASEIPVREQLLEIEGLDFEHRLFEESVAHYMGKYLIKTGDRGKSIQTEKDTATPKPTE